MKQESPLSGTSNHVRALYASASRERGEAKRKLENPLRQHTGKYESDVLLYTPRCLASLSRIILQPRAVAFSATHESSCQSLLSVSRVSEKLFRPLWNNKKSFFHSSRFETKKSREGGKLNQVKVRDEGSRKFLEGDKKDSTQLFRFLRFGENVHSVLCQPKMIYYLMVSCKRLRLPLT